MIRRVRESLQEPSAKLLAQEVNACLEQANRKVRWRYTVKHLVDDDPISPWDFAVVTGTSASVPSSAVPGDQFKICTTSGTLTLSGRGAFIRGTSTLGITDTPVELTYDGVAWW